MRKYYENGSVLEFCFRLEEGLAFVPNPLINFILEGIIARALELYGIKLCALVWMLNHVHLIVVVENPADVERFCCSLKGESSHMINRLLGRRQKTNWVKGTKSPLYLLTPEAVKKRLAYLYNNPTRADYEATIEKYPGVNSWSAFAEGRAEEEVYKVSRCSIPLLFSAANSISEVNRLVERLKRKEEGVRKLQLRYEPDAWMDSFEELKGVAPEDINRDIIKVVREKEKKYQAKRKSEGREPVGATRLQRQSMLKAYIPKNYSSTKRVLADTPEQEQSFLQYLNWIFEKGKQVYERWKKGEVSLRMPAGLIAPRLPTLLCAWSP